MEWVLAHMEDADFNTPLPEPSASGGGGGDSSSAADPESVAMLSSMGFTEHQATAALKVRESRPGCRAISAVCNTPCAMSPSQCPVGQPREPPEGAGCWLGIMFLCVGY